MSTGPAITIKVANGAGREIMAPVRGVSFGLDAVHALVGNRLNPDMPLFTFRHEGETIVMTLRDMHLAP